MKQKSAFVAEGEGDAYFARNQFSYASQHDRLSPDLQFYARYLKIPAGGDRRRLLEIGCANGAKLAALCAASGCVGSGLDPSSSAIEDGRSRFPNLDLRVGTADELPFDDGSRTCRQGTGTRDVPIYRGSRAYRMTFSRRCRGQFTPAQGESG